MKNFILLLTTLFLATGFYSCEKKVETIDTAHCGNGIKDGDEKEVDCGGAGCDACAPRGTFFCNIGNTTFTVPDAIGQVFSPSIRLYANDSRPLLLMFVPTATNQSLPINYVSFAYRGEAYTLRDSGSVVLTKLDTVRKIISGTFYVNARRTTSSDTTSIQNGVFENIRY